MIDEASTALLGLGLVAAGLWNGWETYQTRRIAREQAHKLDETHKQVAVNGHKSATPTLLDKVDTLTKRAQDAHDAAVEAALAAKVAGRMLDGHLDRSSDDRARLWVHLRAVEQRLGIADDREETP